MGESAPAAPEQVVLTAGRVSGVLGERMKAPPAIAQIKLYLQGLTPDALAREALRIDRIQRGVDDEGLVVLVEAIKGARPPERPVAAAPPEKAHRPARSSRPAAPAATPPAPAPPAVDPAFLRAHGTHIYGSGYALKVELDLLRRDEEREQPVYTLQIEGAKKRAGADGYAWDRKIALQLTRSELPELAAFLLGFAGTSLQFTNHGPNRNKSLTVEDQGDKLFVRIAEAGSAPVAVPVEPRDVFAWGELCLVALHLNKPSLTTDAHLALLRRLGRMTVTPNTRART